MKRTFLYWSQNLVGTNISFIFNLAIVLIGGGMYSFGSWGSPFALLLFGVISPTLYTTCIYYTLRYIVENTPDHPIKGAFPSRLSSSTLMAFDIVIIIAIASLIHFGVLDYLLIRLLQTVIFPAIMLLMLRMLFLSVQGGGNQGREG